MNWYQYPKAIPLHNTPVLVLTEQGQQYTAKMLHKEKLRPYEESIQISTSYGVISTYMDARDLYCEKWLTQSPTNQTWVILTSPTFKWLPLP